MAEEKALDPARKLFRDYGGAVLVAVAIALVIRFFLFEAYKIPSASMRPALEPGDTIFVAKWPFGLRLPGAESAFTSGRAPVHGEIVVFSLPSDPRRDYIKRVVGLPGDTVEIRKGRVVLNGKELAEGVEKSRVCGPEKMVSYTYLACWEPPLVEDFGPERVPEGSVFVLGDLRSEGPEARKPRSWGLVPRSAIKAKALWVWLSIEPPGGRATSWFSRIRFERMFQRIH